MEQCFSVAFVSSSLQFEQWMVAGYNLLHSFYFLTLSLTRPLRLRTEIIGRVFRFLDKK